jgi:hypothetical protein
MAQRRVTKADAEEILANHHTTYTDPDGNLSYVGHTNGRVIRVVIVGVTVNPPVIKTVIVIAD